MAEAVLRTDTKGWVEIEITLSVISRTYAIQFFTLLPDVACRKLEACELCLTGQENKHVSVNHCMVEVAKELGDGTLIPEKFTFFMWKYLTGR